MPDKCPYNPECEYWDLEMGCMDFRCDMPEDWEPPEAT